MSLKSFSRRPKRFAGVDCSTNSIAFGVIEDGELVDHGEVYFQGATVFERMLDAKKKTAELVTSGRLKVDVVTFESAVIVRSAATGLKMAYVFGACMAEIMAGGARINEVKPLEWQSGIGNPALTRAEKLKIQKEFPDKSKTWYSNKGRELRKQRTMDIVNARFGTKIDSDNIGDSVGIVLHASKKLG